MLEEICLMHWCPCSLGYGIVVVWMAGRTCLDAVEVVLVVVVALVDVPSADQVCNRQSPERVPVGAWLAPVIPAYTAEGE